ncbi:hypothetical protein Plhal304r1_c033g0104681 [Plasmopara halstedii]
MAISSSDLSDACAPAQSIVKASCIEAYSDLIDIEENEGLCREIQALLCVNKSLEKEMQELRSECMEHESNKIKTLEHELEKVDEELTYLHSQCRSMRDMIRRANADQGIKKESAQLHVSRSFSFAFSQTMQQVKDIALPLQQHSSTVVHGLTKAASFVIPPTAKLSPHRVERTKSSRTILSLIKDTTDSTANLFFSTQHSGVPQKSEV